MKRSDIPDRFVFKKEFLPEVEWFNLGESAMVDPDGKFLVEPVCPQEEILYAEVDTRKMKGHAISLIWLNTTEDQTFSN
jgi:hypothetical protein